MALKCETCGAENAAVNRYCGQCGKMLQQTTSSMPEEFWREDASYHQFDQVEASADLPPEVIDFDNQIPLIADEGTDRRIHLPPDLAEQVHDHLQREAELHDQFLHRSVPHSEVLAEKEAERESLRDSHDDFLRWDDQEAVASNIGNNRERYVAEDDAVPDRAYEPAAASQVRRNFLPEGEKTNRTGVSGPSFLGLTDDSTPEYDIEEREPDSNLRRNTALAILAAVTILAALQWRSIRDYGLSYMQNGSMEVKQHEKGEAGNPPAVAADNTSRDLPSASAKTGAPQSVENSPNANRPLPVQQAAKPTEEAPASRSEASKMPAMSAPLAGQPAGFSEKKPPEKKRPVKKTQVVAGRSATKAHSRTAASVRAAHGVSPASSATALGADEMKRAANASDAEARAAWLWKAVGKGNPQASVELARMYERGSGVVRSCAQAEVLLHSAAAKGNSQAKLDLQQIRTRGGCSER